MGERPEWVEEIVRGIADLSARLERVETELPRLRGDLMARMDRLQDRLSQMIGSRTSE